MTTKDAKPKRTRTRKPQPAKGAVAQVVPDDALGVTVEGSGDAAEEQPDPAAPAPVAAPVPWDVDVSRFADLARIVVFRMAGQRYALPIEAVQEIQQLVAISEMPGSAGAVLGVINLRGQVIPAIDMRLLVGLSARDLDLETPMVLAYTAYGLVALIVDEVEDVVEVPAGSMQPPSPVHALADRLLGVCMLEDGLVFVFDMDAVIPPEMAAVAMTL